MLDWKLKDLEFCIVNLSFSFSHYHLHDRGKKFKEKDIHQSSQLGPKYVGDIDLVDHIAIIEDEEVEEAKNLQKFFQHIFFGL